MKVIVVTPCGRKKYLQILLQNLLKNKEQFDQWHLWVNTPIAEDREYINELVLTYDWIKAITRPTYEDVAWNNIYQFWKYYKDPDTVYVRLDDDVVYLERGFIKKLTDFTQQNPQFLMVFANIVNNGIISHVHQRLNAINVPFHISYTPFNELYWGSPDGTLTSAQIVEGVHREFIKSVLEGDKEKYYFKQWNIDFPSEGQRVFINAVCWLGETFQRLNVEVPPDEEFYLNVTLPQQVNMPTTVYGECLCAHFAFGPQRETGIDNTDLLEEFVKIQDI